MLSFSIYLVLLSIPGFLLLVISNLVREGVQFKIGADTYLFSVSLSYAIAIILLLFFRVYGEHASVFFLAYLFFFLFEVLLLVYLFINKGVSLKYFKLNDHVGKLIFSLSMLIYLFYLINVGPYLEIPSDAWWHLGEIQSMYQLVDGDALPTGEFNHVIRNQNGFWYYIVAAVIYWSGDEYIQALYSVSYVNSLLLLIAVYCFALLILKKWRVSYISRHFMAAFSMLFTLLHFGVSEFSFVRYYSYAPVMLNFILYLTSIVLVLKYMKKKQWVIWPVFLLILLVITMALVHLQEILLLSIVVFGLVLYQYILNKTSSSMSGRNNESGVWSSLWMTSNKKIAILSYTAISSYLIIHVFMILTDTRHFPFELAEIISYESILPFMDGFGMVLLDPRAKFYEVLTFWGVVVYVLYFIKIREFIGNPYLMVGMLLPFFTVFNPIFTDFFFRFSWAEVLYRICYIIPLSLVGGYLFVTHMRELFDKGRYFLKRVYNFFAIVALIFFLFAFELSGFSSPSRMITLAEVKAGNDHRNWSELIDYLNSSESKTTVHTDKITGYVLKALTHHRYTGYKFSGRKAVALTVAEFENNISNMVGELLIINLKSGVWSDAGFKSNHWPGNVLNMRQYYTSEFLEYVDGNIDVFDELWEKDGIVVYRIIGSK